MGSMSSIRTGSKYGRSKRTVNLQLNFNSISDLLVRVSSCTGLTVHHLLNIITVFLISSLDALSKLE